MPSLPSVEERGTFRLVRSLTSRIDDSSKYKGADLNETLLQGHQHYPSLAMPI